MLSKRLIKSNDAGGGVCASDITDIFDDSSGIALYQLNWDGSDMSGNYDGVATDVSFVNGHIDSAGSFNGSSSKVEETSLRMQTSNGYSFWFKTSYAGRQTFFMLGNGSYSDGAELISNTSLQSYFNEGTYYKNYTIPSVSDGNWHHIVVTNNSTTTRNTYLDGSLLVASTEAASNSRIGTGLLIGNLFQTPTYYFNGLIDQFRVFNKAISAAEVSTLYAEVACEKTCTTDTPQIVPDCVAYYKLDGNATDSNGSGTLYDGTAIGSPSYTQGRFGSAVNLPNLSTDAIQLPFSPSYFSNTNRSVSLWIQMDSLVENGQAGSYAFNVGSGSWRVIVGNTGFAFAKYLDGSNFENLSYSVAPTLSQWYHIVATASTTSGMKIYVDAIERDSGTYSGAIDTFYNDCGLGEYIVYQNRRGFTGDIDQVKIFDRAITAAEVTTLYNEVYCKNNDHFNIYTSYDTGVSWNTNVGDNPQAIRFNNDGTAVYVLQFSNKRISQFNLSTAYDISTASGSVNDNTFTSGNVSFFFNSNGTKLYTVDFYADTIYEHNLSTAYLVSSASSAVASIGVSAKDDTPFDIFFKPDGSKMYFLGLQNKSIYEYNLSTLYSLSSATFANSYNFNDGGYKFTFNSTGTKFYKSTPVGTDYYIYEYYLDTAWDISSSNFSGNILQTSFGANGLVLSNDDLALITVERFNNNSAVAFEYLDE